MGYDRKRRRAERFKLIKGGLGTQPPAPSALTQRERLGQAIKILVEQFRKEKNPLSQAEEIRVVMDVAAFMAIGLGADAPQFCDVAFHVFEEMQKELNKSPLGDGPKSA